VKISTIRMRNFMVHDSFEVALPPSGLVVVTGQNGAGKSSIIEAVSFALWGESLRRGDPWREGQEGHAQVVTPDLDAVRKRSSGGKTTLTWTRLGTHAPTPRYETTTKAQEALEHVIGPWEIWRYSHVFSSADAASFTLARDADRKRLIETILGNDRFDAASAKARSLLRAAQDGEAQQRAALDRKRAALEAERRRRDEAQEGLAGLPRTKAGTANGAAEARLGELDSMIAGAEEEMKALRKAIREADRAGAEQAAQAKEIERRLANLRGALCPTCGQKIKPSVVKAEDEKISSLQAEAEKARKSAKRKVSSYEADLEDLEGSVEQLRQQRAQLSTEVEAAKASVKQRARFEKIIADAVSQIERLEVEVNNHHAEHAHYAAEVAELEEVDQVLGLRGVRAHLLGGALAAIEQVGNARLSQITGEPLTMRLKSYTEKKSEKGAVIDAISLEVQGMKRGKSYRDTSGGERRRLDIAILLAIAEVAQAGSGQEGGTLFFDEVFDALDEEGVEAVSSTLTALAQDRCVVVITHNPHLVRGLSADTRIDLRRDVKIVGDEAPEVAVE